MRDAAYAHTLDRIIDNVDYAPVPYSYAPLVFVALEFLASCGARVSCQSQNLAVDAAKDGIVEGVEFLLGGRFDDDE